MNNVKSVYQRFECTTARPACGHRSDHSCCLFSRHSFAYYTPGLPSRGTSAGQTTRSPRFLLRRRRANPREARRGTAEGYSPWSPIYLTLVIKGCSFPEKFEQRHSKRTPKGRPFYNVWILAQ